MPKNFSHLATPSSVRVTFLSFSSMVKSSSAVSLLTQESALWYRSVDLSPLPEIISGVLASSIRDRVYLVDDGKVQISLDKLLFVDGHVIPEVVKTEFIVGPICDIRIISRLFCIIAHTLDDAAHGQAQESIYLSIHSASRLAR